MRNRWVTAAWAGQPLSGHSCPRQPAGRCAGAGNQTRQAAWGRTPLCPIYGMKMTSRQSAAFVSDLISCFILSDLASRPAASLATAVRDSREREPVFPPPASR